LLKHAKDSLNRLFRAGRGDFPCLAPAAYGLSGVWLQQAGSHAHAQQGHVSSGVTEQKEEENFAKVYDLVNAGPRHRFTVSGKIVSNCNFLIAYGGGHTTLAENLSIEIELAKDLMSRTFALYSRVQPWQNEVIHFAETHGYSQTAYGNRRHVSKDIHSPDKSKRLRMQRQAVNAVIQSSAADILKVVRQEMFNRRLREKYHMEAVYPIYDELTASIPVEAAAEYAFEMREIMELTPPGYPTYMMCELSIGPTWGNQTELKFDATAISEYLYSLKEAA
jgi:hypothetical protein